MREKRQTTLPAEIVRAAVLRVSDQIDWRFEAGEIRGKRLVPDTVETIDLQDLDPVTLLPKEGTIVVESLLHSIREDRKNQNPEDSAQAQVCGTFC